MLARNWSHFVELAGRILNRPPMLSLRTHDFGASLAPVNGGGRLASEGLSRGDTHSVCNEFRFVALLHAARKVHLPS